MDTFKTIAELVEKSKSEQKSMWEIMLTQEVAETGVPREAVFDHMKKYFQTMKQAAQRGVQGVDSRSGLTGGDGKRIYDYAQSGKGLTDPVFLRALAYAVATNEVNASMGVVCATPTAGSCGVLPAVLLAVQEKLNLPDEVVVRYLFTAGAVGYVIANNASISGAVGGCQAEVGSASAMAAAAIVEMAGGSPEQAAEAMAIALKNMLGLTCDPVAGLVEVPCVKRNAAGAANALSAAEMALAGVRSRIPWDEVIEAMQRIGEVMPAALKETSLGGLAATPTGLKWKALME